jgi:hypothetical protein
MCWIYRRKCHCELQSRSWPWEPQELVSHWIKCGVTTACIMVHTPCGQTWFGHDTARANSAPVLARRALGVSLFLTNKNDTSQCFVNESSTEAYKCFGDHWHSLRDVRGRVATVTVVATLNQGSEHGQTRTHCKMSAPQVWPLEARRPTTRTTTCSSTRAAVRSRRRTRLRTWQQQQLPHLDW